MCDIQSLFETKKKDSSPEEMGMNLDVRFFKGCWLKQLYIPSEVTAFNILNQFIWTPNYNKIQS